jgi:hypothetical protein
MKKIIRSKTNSKMVNDCSHVCTYCVQDSICNSCHDIHSCVTCDILLTEMHLDMHSFTDIDYYEMTLCKSWFITTVKKHIIKIDFYIY